jgi:hypothetical protein
MVLAALSLLVLLAVVIKGLRYNPALTLLVLAVTGAAQHFGALPLPHALTAPLVQLWSHVTAR